jgi:hypothetical protein
MTERLAARYRRFAEIEAHGHSPLYEGLALGVAGDADVLAFLSGLPPDKQQPNLLFAAVRHVAGIQADVPSFRSALLAQPDRVRAVMLSRRTQTNEPARCAVLLPVLARLPQPLALLEVGAAAGLCLLPDRYGYDYGGNRLGDGPPVFACKAHGGTPVPTALPQVIWRAGLDLHPLDPRNAEQAAWLETLVWPDQPHRLARLQSALAVAQADPAPVRRGDLLPDLRRLAAEAPAKATLVVFHTAVLAYVADPAARAAFAAAVGTLGAVWLSNEAPGVFPSVVARVPERGPRGAFLLAVDGEPIAWTDPHGAWIEWIEKTGQSPGRFV